MNETKFTEKLKVVAKYMTNILAIVNALIIGLDPIWGIPYADKVSATITVIIAVTGTYLLGSKTVQSITKGKE